MSTLESLKYNYYDDNDTNTGSITQKEMAGMLLHVLQLCSATVRFNNSNTNNGDNTDNGDDNNYKNREKGNDYTLKYDNIGQLYNIERNGSITSIFGDRYQYHELKEEEGCNSITKNDLNESFALPSPAREALLSFAVMILAKDRYLRSVSNQSFFAPTEEEGQQEEKYENDSMLLVINWKALLRMLLRTTPYLDDHETDNPQSDSLSHQNTVLKRTISLIRYSRKFFDQGLSVKQNIISNKTAMEVWKMVKSDLMYQSHSNACYRALILLYLFHPTRCSSEFYLDVMPSWLESWSSIDRNPEFDFLWVNMFCRARKYVCSLQYDWGPLRRRLLTLCGYWLQIPVGGTSDKSFPHAAEAKSRTIPSRLKTFVRSDSSYQEGVDFVSKMSKLLIFCCGKDDGDDHERDNTVSNDTEDKTRVSNGTDGMLRFFSFVGPYFNPSNTGSWTFPLGVMLHYVSYELCRRIGRDTSQQNLILARPKLASKIAEVEPYKAIPCIPDHEIVLILDKILPLCQQALYSKSAHVSRAGEAALLYLSQIDYKVCAPLLDFAMRALDVSSVTQSHQAPSALSTMNRLILPSLQTNPLILLERLPEILRLSLAGIDGNDQDKTMRTLVLYRTLTSWLPVGSSSKVADSIQYRKDSLGGEDGCDILLYNSDRATYWKSLKQLSSDSILFQPKFAEPYEPGDEDMHLKALNLAREASHAMADWSLTFLERIYGIFRVAGQQEKIGKSHGVATKRSSAADVSQARNFARILKECLQQFFAAMDEKRFNAAVVSVKCFLTEETHSLAVKYTSSLCESVCAARFDDTTEEIDSPGLKYLISSLTLDMNDLSKNTILYRVRCLGGAVRRAGSSVVIFREQLLNTLEFTLNHSNKHIFKAGCKVFRHLLSSQSDLYPVGTDSCPRVNSSACLGESARLYDDKIKWHVPTASQIDFVAELLSRFVFDRIRKITSQSEFVFVEKDYESDKESKIASKHDYLKEWRDCLRILRYAIRGCPGLLIEMTNSKNGHKVHLDPNEESSIGLIERSSSTSQSIIFSARERIKGLIISFLALIVKELSSFESIAQIEVVSPTHNKKASMIASDAKICKEIAEISQLLFARRSVSFRCEDAFTLWKAQKDVSYNAVMHNQKQEVLSMLQKAGCIQSNLTVWFDNGNGIGKSLPRRMITNRVEIFVNSCQRLASFDVPRRMRRERGLRLSESRDDISYDIEKMHDQVNRLMNINNELQLSHESFALDKYERIVDGMFALACHHNSSVRGYGIRSVEYGFSRYGWFAVERAPRMISAITLRDSEFDIKFGILSCSRLSCIDEPICRKRLSEILKGICMIIIVPRMMKQIMSSEELRIKLIEALCGTQHVVSLLPEEEMQKMVSYLHQIFTSFRSRFYTFPNITNANQMMHEQCISRLSLLIREIKIDDEREAASLNWRNRLIVCWFVMTLVNKRFFLSYRRELLHSLWETCIFLIQNESGQPLQKVALGLLGRLGNILSLMPEKSIALLDKMMHDEFFCKRLCDAFVYNHKEDSNVGGGHHAQWSLGVSEIMKDAASNLAPKVIFPLIRIGRSSSHLKIAHIQMIHILLSEIDNADIEKTIQHLLKIATEFLSLPPSEDQRNQHCASAEILGGVCIYLVDRMTGDEANQLSFHDIIVPFLDTIVDIIPISAIGVLVDTIRYSMSKMPIDIRKMLLTWAVVKIEKSLWREDNDSCNSGIDGFALQSKYLSLMNAIIIEMDFQTEVEQYDHLSDELHSIHVYAGDRSRHQQNADKILKCSWGIVCNRLLPHLLLALGHPYQSCREKIASTLFRIGYTYRNRHSYQNECCDQTDPCSLIVTKLLSLKSTNDNSSKIYQHSLITSRLFLSHCVHNGESKREFIDYIIPLLPLAFEAIIRADDVVEAKEDDPELRMLQAQVVQAFRYTISEISVSCNASASDMTRVLSALETVSQHSSWQLRLAVAHYLRCFQGKHKFLFTTQQTKKIAKIVARLLADDRREVSAAAMAALAGILAATPLSMVNVLVEKYRKKANNSVIKKLKNKHITEEQQDKDKLVKEERERAIKQQTSVYFLCAAVLATPYDTPAYVPVALAALSKHSYEHSAPFGIRETVKRTCSEYKRTHVSDNWEVHKKQFTRDQLEAFEDVVSTPHYYA